MTADVINSFFGWAPLTIFLIILAVAYYSKRGETAHAVQLGKTFACAQCGRRGKHDQMVPVTEGAAVVWYCGRCSSPRH